MSSNYSNLTLDELLLSIKNGDIKAFDNLYSRTWNELYVHALQKVKDEATAKDIIQDIYINFWDKRENRDIVNVKSYLNQAVRFKVIDLIRKNKYTFVSIDNFVDIIDEIEGADSTYLTKELDLLIRAWADTLSAKRKAIFLLKYEKNYNSQEISEHLQIPRKTIQNQLITITKQLKEELPKIFIYLFFFLSGK